MNHFTLQQLSFLSGLPDKTITFWNKKYSLFHLSETANFKENKFSGEDLQRLLNIATLFHLEKKYEIDKICEWDNVELQTKVEIELMSNLIQKNQNEDIINQLVVSCLTYNSFRFDLILNTAIKKLSHHDFYNYVLYPFLYRIYETFRDENKKPVQFYYMKNLLKRKIYNLLDKTSSYVEKKNSVLLFLPENEVNEIGLLFCDLVLQEKGFKTYYIGLHQTIETVEQAMFDLNPDILVSYISSKDNIASYENIIESLDLEKNRLFLLGTKVSLKAIKTQKCKKVFELDELYSLLEEFETKKTELV